MKIPSARSIVIFAILCIAGVCLVVFGQAATDGAVRTVLPLVGASIFTSALTYFLVKAG